MIFCVDGNKVYIQYFLFFFIKSIKNNWYSLGNVNKDFFMFSQFGGFFFRDKIFDLQYLYMEQVFY